MAYYDNQQVALEAKRGLTWVHDGEGGNGDVAADLNTFLLPVKVT